MKKNLNILFIFFALNSCVKEVSVNDIALKQYICVNCLFSTEKYFNVQISLTGKNINDNNTIPINDANVVLWSGNEIVEKLTLDSTGYYSTKIHKPVVNKVYTIKVDIDGFEQVSATDFIPDQIPILRHNIEFDNFMMEKAIFSTVNFSFLDLIDKENYYLLNVIRKFYNPFSQKHITTSGLIRSDDEIFIRDENHTTTWDWDCTNFLIFNDNNISTITSNYFTIYLFESDGEVVSDDYNETKILVLKNISKHCYEYFKSLKVHSVVINEPIFNQTNYYYNIYSNVENGLGIFAGYNNYLDTFLLNGQKYKCIEF